jgi:predicted XRE-type DNA-binding protein
MAITTNQELAQAVNIAIKESGVKKSYIADKLEISRQAFSNFMSKQNFSLDDANKILEIINKKAVTEIHEKN